MRWRERQSHQPVLLRQQKRATGPQQQLMSLLGKK